MSESGNEVSRMDQFENSLAKIEEQLQALATIVANTAAPRIGGNLESIRQVEPLVGMEDDLPDDDMADYATERTVTVMSKSVNDESRLDRLEIKVAEIVEQLQAWTNVVASLAVHHVTSDKDSCDHSKKTIEEPSRTKTTSSEVIPARGRRFSKFGRPLSEVFKELKMKGLLNPLEPRPLPNPVPYYLNQNLYCHFHQQKGHDTDNCVRLQHEIQNLIDSHKIPNPEKGQPNTHKKPPLTRKINADLPDSCVLQSQRNQTSHIGIQDNNGKREIEQRGGFWESYSDSYETRESGSVWEEELLYLEKLMAEGIKKAKEDKIANQGDVCYPDLIQL